MEKKEKKIDFKNIMLNKKLPILTLDQRWHELFPEDEKSFQIKNLEQKVNKLLKKQGKLVNDIKDMKALKKTLMNDIVTNMDIGSNEEGKAKAKKLEKNKQYIEEINEKLTKAMNELADMPYQIKEANEELMLESMKLCYQKMRHNKQEIGKVTSWIARLREELKEKILIKQDMEEKNTKIYTYMHDIIGAQMMEIFDQEEKEV